MGKLRKIGKKIAGAFRKVGRKLKKGLGKVAKAFGKLGPLGSIALSFILPGLGNIAGWLGNTISTMGPAGKFLVDIATSVVNGAKFVKGKIVGGMSKVFNTVTGAIEGGMNAVSRGVGGTGQIGTSFRNFVSDVTGGFVEKSTQGIELEASQFESTLQDTIAKNTGDFDGSSYIEKDGVFTFTDKEGKVIETLTSPDAKRYMEMTDNDTLFDDDYGTKPVVDSKSKSKLSITDTIKDKDLTIREKINTSKEYAAYKPIEAVRMAGETINQAETDFENAELYYAKQKSNYFKDQASVQLGALQNYSSVTPTAQFVDYSNFDFNQDPAKQYLSYRGIQGNVNPVDVGGYGFDYEAFLRAQLGEESYA